MARGTMLEMLQRVGRFLPLEEAPNLPWVLAERVHDPAYLERRRNPQRPITARLGTVEAALEAVDTTKPDNATGFLERP